MKMKPFLNAQKVALGLTGATPREFLEALTKPLVKDGIVTDGERFVQDLESREKQLTTVMENGVALPHARSPVVRRVGLTVGVVKGDGVRFDPDSDALVRIFFCIAVPTFAPTAHLPLLQAVAAFARDPKRLEKLAASKTPGAAVKQLTTFSG